MAESLLALHQCSLIGLEDSPDLLRRSLLQRDGSQDCLLWDSKEAHHSKAVQRLAFTPAAPGHDSSTSSLARAVAACELSLREAGSSILDSSLPLFSESPAIVGKQLPRSRFRKRSKAGAAGEIAAGAVQHSILQQQQGRHAGPPAANSAAHVDSSNASSACLESSRGILSLNSDHSNRAVRPATQPQQLDDQQCFHNKENYCPAVADTAAAADNSQPSQPSNGKNDLSLLQALLDDSNCSAASLLQPSLGTLLQTDAAPAPAAETGSYYSCYDVGHSCMRASAGSDVSSFQGFWGPRSAVRSPFSTPHTTRAPAAAGVLATPTRLLLTVATVGGAGELPATTGAEGTLECRSSCESWQECNSAQQPDNKTEPAAGPEEEVVPAETATHVDAYSQQHQQHLLQQQQQPGWDQLLLLLSLDESVSLIQVASQTCEPDNHNTAETAAHSIQWVDGLTESAELQRPPSVDSLGADGSEPTSPTVLASPAGSMLPSATSGSSWGGFGPVSSRYSDCCPSPASPDVFGSPTVLLSSPVPDADAAGTAAAGVTAATRHRSVLKQKSRSNKTEAGTAAGVTTEADAMPAHSRSDQSGQQAADECASTTAAGGSADGHNQQPQRPNSIEYSPIRGVTLWDNNGESPSVAGWLGTPVSTPPGQQQEPSQPQQQLVLAPHLAADSAASPAWHLHHQQHQQGMHGGNALLQQLLDDSSESWIDSGIPGEQLMQTPGNASFASQALAALAAAADYTTPQHGQQQQQQGVSTGNQAAARGLPSSLRLRLPESQGALTLSPCVSPSRSPAESVDSFTYAAAGEPYSSIEDGQKQHDHQANDSQEWCAYEGLGEVLTPDAVATPATVVCKDGWGAHVAAAVCAATPEPFAAAVGAAANHEASFSRADGGSVKWRPNPSALLDSSSEPIPAAAAGDHLSADGCSVARMQQASSNSGADLDGTAAMQELVGRLAAAELQCGKHQQEAMQARQLALEKELELQVLRNALKLSEVEGSSCLDALAATIDLIADADGNNSVSNSVEFTTAAAEGPSAAAGCEASEEETLEHSSSTGDQQQVQQEADQLRQQNAALLQHNAAMQATMVEAAQQLDVLEVRVTELSAEKAAAEALLSEAEQQWNEQLSKQEEFTQSELEEQQQQHEAEVRDLHNRLEDVSAQLQQGQQEVSRQAEQLQQLQAELQSCQQELSASQQQVQQQQQQLQDLEQQQAGKASDSAASTEQLHRQVQQLLTAKRELQETNTRLIDAEAEYASNQMMLGSKNQELATQLKDAQAANKQLEETVQQLQAQNYSLSQMCQNLKATASGGGQPSSAITAASHCSAVGATGEAANTAPTPMRRRMAAVNQQLERRCQELLEQKQQLALQLQELQKQQRQGSGGAGVAADAATVEQQQALLQELHAQVEHLSTCNDEVLVQLQDLDYEHQQMLGEREQLVAEIKQLRDSLAQLQLAEGEHSRAAAGTDRNCLQGAAQSEASAAAEQAVAELQADNAALLQDIEQLQSELLISKQRLAQQQQQNDQLQNQVDTADAAAAGDQQQVKEELADARSAAAAAAAECQQLTKQLAAMQQRLDDAVQQQQMQMHQQQSHEEQLKMSNTALFARCQELESQLRQLQSQLQLQQREHEQQLLATAAAAAPRGSKAPAERRSGSNSNPAKRDQEQLVAELRGRLKDVLDLLEEKQQLQQQQAKQHEARESELATQCDILAQQLRESQQQLQQLLKQHEVVVAQLQDLRSENEQLLKSNKDLQQQLVAARSNKLADHELQIVQQQLLALQAEHSEVTARLTGLSSNHAAMAGKCDTLQQRLAAAEIGKAAAEQAAAAAGITALDAEKAAAAAERSVAELERAVDRLHQQNQALIEQTVQLQLVDPPAAPASSSSKAVQVELVANVPAIAAAEGNDSSKHRKRWTADLAVQVDLGATTEQATAVQQLLLLQAQQQLQDMEQQNKQAALRLVESKGRMAELQFSIQQQEHQLKAAEQKLAQAAKLHKQQALSLQSENEQIVRQLADARKQLAALQTANKQLDSKVSQQQETVERQHQQLAQKQRELLVQQQELAQKQQESDKLAATVAASQQQLQHLQQQVLDMQQQKTQDRLQVATAASELQKAKEHAQQLLAAKDRDAANVAALQQQVQQLQLQVQQQQQAVAGQECAAAAAHEEFGRSKQQFQLLLQEKEALAVELQQTKVAVDFLEDSVRRLGQHNASLVQQLHDTIAAAAKTAETTQASNTQAAATAVQSSGPISPRTLQQIVTAATKVNEKNKRLKKQLQALQGPKE